MSREIDELSYYENLLEEGEDIFGISKLKEKKNHKRKEEKKNLIPDLPECLIYEILVRIPAMYLHDTFRYICKSWYNMICSSKFIEQNTFWNKPELLIQTPTGHMMTYKGKSLEMEERELEFKLHDFGMRRMGRIRSSCNGMILINDPTQKKVPHMVHNHMRMVNDPTRKRVLQVMNLVTKCSITLPPCPSGCQHKNCGSALGFNPSTKEYIVVHIYSHGFGFEIFTLGCSENEWRRIPGPFKEQYDRPFNLDFDWSDPVSINGQVLHWYVDSSKYIISMDVSNETFRKTNLPDIGQKIKKSNYDLVEMSSYLSVLYNVSSTQIDIWILKDFQGQVWFKTHSIVTELINYTVSKESSSSTEYHNALPALHKLVPLASLRNGEVILFKHDSNGTDNRLYLYDTKIRELKKFKMKFKNEHIFVPHRSSLGWYKSENEKLLPCDTSSS